jgi:putative hydrolase of HD superfamily
MNYPSIDNILDFAGLLNKFRLIERTVLFKGSDRKENDAEHSFSLAMLAWYINTTYKLGFDIDKLFKYSLAHDLVEVYAGDTYFIQNKDDSVAKKKQRESDAANKLRLDFPEFEEMHNIIELYEKREDPESRFIYALDKIDPMISIYVDGGRALKEYNVDLQTVKDNKISKVSVDSTIKDIYDQLIRKFEENELSIFNKK